jgi:hypothetical protein
METCIIHSKLLQTFRKTSFDLSAESPNTQGEKQ